MAKVYLAIDTKDKDFERALVDYALKAKEGWVFIHVHPSVAKLLELMERTDFGHVSFDVRHGLPENVSITKRLKIN